MSLGFSRENVMHPQDQVATELPVCSHSPSCQGLQEEMEEEVQGPAARETYQEDAAVPIISGPTCALVLPV